MLVDTLARPLRNLRLSVTDRCSLRCEYGMPEDEYAWLPREDMLHFEDPQGSASRNAHAGGQERTALDAFRRIVHVLRTSTRLAELRVGLSRVRYAS